MSPEHSGAICQLVASHPIGLLYPTQEVAMPPKLTYAIKFVADMDHAIRFHRDTLGLR